MWYRHHDPCQRPVVSSVGDPQPLYNSSTESGFIASRFFVLGTPIHTTCILCVTIRAPLRAVRLVRYALYHPDSSRTSRGGRGARAPVTQTLRSPPLAAESRLCFALPVTIDGRRPRLQIQAHRSLPESARRHGSSSRPPTIRPPPPAPGAHPLSPAKTTLNW